MPAERVPVSPRVLALIRTAGRPDDDAVPDLQVLRALLTDEEPSLARLALTSLGAYRRVVHTLHATSARVDDSGGDLVDA